MASSSTSTLRADFAAEGASINAVLRRCRWQYSPQLTPDAIRAGAASRMERRQGHGNLWISGATAAHEAVDNIVDYNGRLVERMAVAFAGGEPSSPETPASSAEQLRFSYDDK